MIQFFDRQIVQGNLFLGRVMGLLMMGTGVLSVIIGFISLAHTIWFATHSSKADGQIIAMNPSVGDNGAKEYQPVYTFSEVSGIVHTQVCTASSSDLFFKTGDKVTVLYNPASPTHSDIDSFDTMWLQPIALIIIGILSISFASVVLWIVIRFKNKHVPNAI